METFKPGEYLYQQGKPSQTVFFISSGAVELHKKAAVVDSKKLPVASNQWHIVETKISHSFVVRTVSDYCAEEVMFGTSNFVDYSAKCLTTVKVFGFHQQTLLNNFPRKLVEILHKRMMESTELTQKAMNKFAAQQRLKRKVHYLHPWFLALVFSDFFPSPIFIAAIQHVPCSSGQEQVAPRAEAAL